MNALRIAIEYLKAHRQIRFIGLNRLDVEARCLHEIDTLGACRRSAVATLRTPHSAAPRVPISRRHLASVSNVYLAIALGLVLHAPAKLVSANL